MMDHKDYKVIASALRNMPLRDKIAVYRRLSPALIADNGRFDPIKFGEVMKIPRLLCQEALTEHLNKEEVGNASS